MYIFRLFSNFARLCIGGGKLKLGRFFSAAVGRLHGGINQLSAETRRRQSGGYLLKHPPLLSQPQLLHHLAVGPADALVCQRWDPL